MLSLGDKEKMSRAEILNQLVRLVKYNRAGILFDFLQSGDT